MKENRGALPPRTVAEQILWLRQDVPTTPMHVLKLAYLSHGWMLGVFGRGLIAEPAEAWRYGPVVPTVYRTYKSFRGDPIATPLADKSADLDEDQNELLGEVLRAYRGLFGVGLVRDYASAEDTLARGLQRWSRRGRDHPRCGARQALCGTAAGRGWRLSGR